MAEEDTPMSDAPAAEEPKPEPKESESTPAIVDSIEVENNDQEEEVLPEASDAEGDDDPEVPDKSGRPVSLPVYKALKAITDTLLEFKVKKGGEYVTRLAAGISTDSTQGLFSFTSLQASSEQAHPTRLLSDHQRTQCH
jgi:hypothetical protein